MSPFIRGFTAELEKSAKLKDWLAPALIGAMGVAGVSQGLPQIATRATKLKQIRTKAETMSLQAKIEKQLAKRTAK